MAWKGDRYLALLIVSYNAMPNVAPILPTLFFARDQRPKLGEMSSTRASSRRAASAEPKASAMSTVAPASKRRRKDSSSGVPDTRKSTGPSVPAAKRSKAHQQPSTGNAFHSVVMVEVAEGFSLSQAACR